MSTAGHIDVRPEQIAGCTIADLTGTLDARTYGGLRDSLLKLAMEQPRALIARVDGLVVSSTSALSLFSAVWMRGPTPGPRYRCCCWPPIRPRAG